jgi:glutathione S-transferase
MYTLYIGNKNYSSWSLRPWVLMKTAGIPFREERITLFDEGYHERILAKSPSGRVPCLHDGERVVWDSLAIAEYLAERHPGLWPADATARAWARSVAAEMHSGFARLRDEFGMNVRLRWKKTPSPAVAEEIARIAALWREGRERFGSVSVSGAFLCGNFGIVDAFWCPVAFRFQTYDVRLDGAADDYLKTLLGLPAMQAWAGDSAQEKERIAYVDPPEMQAQQQ